MLLVDLPTLQNWIAIVLAAETRHPPRAMLVPGLLVDGCETPRIVSPALMPETVKLCSLQEFTETDAGVIELVNLSNCMPLLCVVLTRDRVVEALSRYCKTAPVFQTSPDAGDEGAVPAGTFIEAAEELEAGSVCFAANVFAAPSWAKLDETSPFKLAALTPVTAVPLPLNVVALTVPLTV